MALRVLLADESSTIKKVFQLALQDFAVEVRPVNIGLDVASVAAAFAPDIIFADVLLQKKNGYDVCAELKASATLKSIPVVLMWSGFMELDEDKYQASQANAQLEKPFDVSALRKLVTELVPRTQSQRISQFLNFPKVSTDGAPATAALPPDLPLPPKIDEDFLQVSIPKIKGSEKYRVNLKPEELESTHIPIDYDVPAEKMEIEGMFETPNLGPDDEVEDFQMHERKKPVRSSEVPSDTDSNVQLDLSDLDPPEFTRTRQPANAKASNLTQAPAAPTPPTAPQLSPEQLEAIIRQQSQEVIESIVWKVVPELAKQIIERELNRLLQERDSSHF